MVTRAGFSRWGEVIWGRSLLFKLGADGPAASPELASGCVGSEQDVAELQELGVETAWKRRLSWILVWNRSSSARCHRGGCSKQHLVFGRCYFSPEKGDLERWHVCVKLLIMDPNHEFLWVPGSLRTVALWAFLGSWTAASSPGMMGNF